MGFCGFYSALRPHVCNIILKRIVKGVNLFLACKRVAMGMCITVNQGD